MLTTLLKVQYRGLLSALTHSKKEQGKKAGVGKIILIAFLFALCFLSCFIAFFGLFLLLGTGLAGSGQEWLLFALMGAMVFLVDFITTIFMAKSQLFEAKDNDLLLSMPIRPRDILLSRMLFILLNNYLFEVIIALPTYLVWCVMGMATVGGSILFFISLIFLPLLALALASFVGWLLSIAVKRIKRKNLYTTLLSLVFLGLYIVTVPFLQTYMELVITHAEVVAEAVKTYLAPFYFFGSGIVAGNVWHTLLFVLCMTLPFALCCFILSRTFISIVTHQKGSVQTSGKGEVGQATPIRRSLLKKEFRQLTSSTAYMLNAGLGLIFLLIVGVGMFFLEIEELFMMIPGLPQEVVPAVCTLVICMCSGLIFFTAPSVSLEGQNIYLLRSLPLRGKDLFFAKVYLHLLLVCPVALIASICAIIAFPTNFWMAVLVILVPQIFTIFFALFGIEMNLAFPKFDFENEVVVVKQSMPVLICMLVGMFGVYILAAGGVGLGLLLSSVEGAVALCALIPLGASVGMYFHLDKKSEAIFAKLG